MRLSWWKITSVVLLAYTFAAGLLLDVPRLPQLQETIRNLYFHVCMWFVMMILFIVSAMHAIKFLRAGNFKHDIYSRQFAVVGMVFGLLGYATGMIWMSYTWADPNNTTFVSFSAVAREPKLIGTAIALLIYAAYLVLRDSIQDVDKRARISAVYNLFAFAFLFPTIWVLPRMLPSLHPGQDGNPALNKNDVDVSMRIVFYPAIAGWTLLGVWIASLKVRLNKQTENKLVQQ
jgi:heme exporter protein C